MLGLTNYQMTLPTALSDFITAGGLGGQRVVKSVTFLNTVTPVALFTVTGDVAVRLIGVCKVNVASAGGCTGQVGITADPDALIAVTDITLLAAGDIWYDASPDAEVEALNALAEVIISDGNDIVLTLSATADSGQVDWYCFWTALSAGATVVAA